MERLTALALTTCLTMLTAVPVLAHPGHSHEAAPGGEQHHLLWYALPIVALAIIVTVGWKLRRR